MSTNLTDITLVIKVITDNTPVERLTQSMSKMDKQTQRNALANARLEKSISPLKNHYAGLSSKLGEAERKMDAVFRAGIHMQAMGRDLMGVGRDIAGFARNIVETYAEYDFTLRQTSLALNTNVEWTRRLDKAIQDTAITLGKFKPEEVARAYRIWGAATGDVIESQEDLTRVTKTVRDIMIATAMVGGTLEGNLQGVYAVTQQYNLGIGKASYVTSILSLLTERTALNFGDLATAFQYAGSYTGAIGAKFEDVAQALGIMADAGFKGSKAGRGLSMFFEAIVAPSGPAKKALDGLARSMGAINWKKWVFPRGQFEGMRDLVAKLAGGMEKMTAVERAAFLARAGSNNAVRAALPLLNQQIELWERQRKAGQALTSILDEQKYSLKTAATFFATMSSSFLESFDAIIGSFGNSFFPIIQMIAIEIMRLAGPIMKQLSAVFKDIAKFMEANPAFTEMVVKIGAIVAVVLTLAGALLVALGTMAFFYSNIILLGAGLVPLVMMFVALAAAFAAIAVAIASNTGGITDALVRLGVSVKRVFDIMFGGAEAANIFKDISAAIKSITTGVLTVIADVVNRIADALDSLTPEQIGVIRDIGAALLAWVALNGGLKIFAGLLGSVGLKLVGFAAAGIGLSTISGVVSRLAPAILPLISSIGLLASGFLAVLAAVNPIVWVLGGIAVAVAAAVWAFQTNFMGFRDFVLGLVTWFQTVLPEAINTAMTIIGGLVAGVLSPITDNLPKIMEFINGIVSSIAESWVPVLEHLWEVASSVFGSVAAAFLEVVNSIMPHIQPLVDEILKLVSALVDFLGPAWNAIVVIVGTVVGAIIKFVVGFVNFLAPYIQGFVDLFMRVWGILAEFLVRTVGNFVKIIIDAIKGFVTIIRGIIEVFTGLLTGNWDKVWAGLGTIVGAFVSLVQGVIRGFFETIGNVIRLGLQIVTGLFEFVFGLKPGSILAGIGSFITTFIANVGKFIGQVIATVGSIPGKMGQIGKDVVLGLWEGIKSMFNWMINKISAFIRDVIPEPIRNFLGIKSPSTLMMGLGVNIVEGLARGIDNTTDAYDAMKKQALGLASVASAVLSDATMGLATSPMLVSSTTSNEKTINLNVDVTSADGSVNSVDLSTLSDLITGSDMVRALERMALVD